jgi:predicted nucleic acid-binding protein
LLSHFPLIDLDVNITDLVIQIRREQIKKKATKQPNKKVIQWKLPDAIQAAIALYYNLKLVTRNTQDFGFFVTWYGSIGGHKSTKSLSGKRLN